MLIQEKPCQCFDRIYFVLASSYSPLIHTPQKKNREKKQFGYGKHFFVGRDYLITADGRAIAGSPLL